MSKIHANEDNVGFEIFAMIYRLTQELISLSPDKKKEIISIIAKHHEEIKQILKIN